MKTDRHYIAGAIVFALALSILAFAGAGTSFAGSESRKAVPAVLYNCPPVCPTAPPTQAPTQAPTPRPPTSTDLSQLTALIARPWATVSSIAIVGNFAEACWYSGNVGGAIIATNTSGSWQKLSGGAGGYTATDIVTLIPSIPAAIAQQLVTQAALNQT